MGNDDKRSLGTEDDKNFKAYINEWEKSVDTKHVSRRNTKTTNDDKRSLGTTEDASKTVRAPHRNFEAYRSEWDKSVAKDTHGKPTTTPTPESNEENPWRVEDDTTMV